MGVFICDGGKVSTKNLRSRSGGCFSHYDGRGHVIELSDEAGVSSASYSYDAYGNQIKRTSGEDNAYRFSTKEYSSLTGLIYFGARYYDPEIGRFLTKDPLGFAGGINQYIYCESDPVNWID
ncbi:MAG: RHS repeat-associated core domain-containing protein, partial [Bacteroidota bacterium]|nr:RHS repeat-associated core domain-containing protein [Bacteroidota bacterium]